jgi:hypothetical protein
VVTRNRVTLIGKVRQGWSLAGDGFAGSEPFDKAELEALALLYLEAFSPDLAQRAAQEVLPLEAHGGHLDEPLYEPSRPRAAFNVVCQQRQPAGPQDAVHLADSPAFVRDCAQRIGGHHRDETGVGERQVEGVAFLEVGRPAELSRPIAGDLEDAGAEVYAGEAHIVGIKRQVEASADTDFQGLSRGLGADPGPAVRRQESLEQLYLPVEKGDSLSQYRRQRSWLSW